MGRDDETSSTQQEQSFEEMCAAYEAMDQAEYAAYMNEPDTRDSGANGS
ncbi:hypothetical protein ABZZ36_01800 [Actinacidiphila glaucinigra]